MGGPSEQNTFHNTGQVAGVAVGGSHHTIRIGSVEQDQRQLLTDELEDVLEQMEDGPLGEREQQDVQRVREALGHARAGRLDAARSALTGVGRWVLEVARRAGATALEKELTGLLS